MIGKLLLSLTVEAVIRIRTHVTLKKKQKKTDFQNLTDFVSKINKKTKKKTDFQNLTDFVTKINQTAKSILLINRIINFNF